MAIIQYGGIDHPAGRDAERGSRARARWPWPGRAPGAGGLRSDRVTALILNVVKSASDPSKVLVQCLWCHACDTVDTPLLNDQALPAGTTATHYTGSQATADAALVAAFSAQGITYADTLAATPTASSPLPVAQFNGQLELSVRVLGRKLYDPRKDTTAGGSGSHRLATPSTWEYSDNPSLALADWLHSSVYGAGEAGAVEQRPRRGQRQ